MKVYCKDCKYITYCDAETAFFMRVLEGYYCGALTKHKDKRIFGEDTTRVYVHKSTKDFPNKNNICAHYKRKWWKFWINTNHEES